MNTNLPEQQIVGPCSPVFFILIDTSTGNDMPYQNNGEYVMSADEFSKLMKFNKDFSELVSEYMKALKKEWDRQNKKAV